MDLKTIGMPVSAIMQVRLAVYLSGGLGVQMWHMWDGSWRDTREEFDPKYGDAAALERRGKMCDARRPEEKTYWRRRW